MTDSKMDINMEKRWGIEMVMMKGMMKDTQRVSDMDMR
jgi:hypothetical protein